MGEVKIQLAEEALADEAAAQVSTTPPAEASAAVPAATPAALPRSVPLRSNRLRLSRQPCSMK